MIKFENPTNGRFYYLQTHHDLLGHLVLTVIRGGKGSRFVKHYGYDCPEKIDKEIKRITKLRLNHGYLFSL